MSKNNDTFADLLSSLEENLGREGGWVPPEGGGRPEGPRRNPRRILWIIIPLAVLILFSRLIAFYADLMWYESISLTQVFTTRLWAQFTLFILGALVFWLFSRHSPWRQSPAAIPGCVHSKIASRAARHRVDFLPPE